jgi:hypothetical protein
MIARLALLGCLGLFTFQPSAARGEPAQAAESEEAPLAESFEGLKQGRLVRLMTVDLGMVEGTYLGSSGGDLLLGQQRIPKQSVRKVWVRRRATKVGAIVGGILGGILLGSLGRLSGIECDSAEDPEACNDTTPEVLAGAGIGAALGAGVGAGVGSQIPRWKELGP